MEKRVREESIEFGPWRIEARKGPILSSADGDGYSEELKLPLPEMVFGDTELLVKNTQCDFTLSFTALDALRLVDNNQSLLKVGAAKVWSEHRAESEHIHKVAAPFDWTYTTAYRGTITGDVDIVATDERIDMQKLKQREKINFFQDLMLFEDELADHGAAQLSVKIRVMPTSFFILLRFFLRVDNVLVRINDTRLYHEAGTDFILREYASKEKPASELTDPNADSVTISAQLDSTLESFEKIRFTPVKEAL